MDALIRAVDFAFLIFFLVLNSSYTVLMLLSLAEILLRNARRIDTELHHSLSSYYTIPVSIVAPAYNEALTIEASVKALLALRYPEFEVIVVNDGSRDDTVGTMIEAFDLYPVHPVYRMRVHTKDVRGIYRSRTEPRLIFVDKHNGGKADALNCGINVAQFPLFCGIDADTLILPDALLKVALPFMEDPERTVASGGTIRVANGCKIRGGQVESVGFPSNRVARFQVVEYLRAFLFGRVGWNLLGGTLIISGAFGLFKRQTAIDCGGYTHDTVGEDMELVVKMHRRLREEGTPYRIVFVWDSACYTEVPEDLAVLGRQRDRWHRGLMDSVFRHRVMFMNPRYGVVGTLVFPFFAIFEMLGPLIELIGVAFVLFSFVFGVIDVPFMVLFLTVSVLFGVMLSVLAVVLEEVSYAAFGRWTDLLKICGYAVLENFGYRQLTVWWRVKGMYAFIRGQKQWGAMVRKGFAQKGPS
ncbi:MAG: glycosyltransferase family 2 protein [Myxococcales bacterium]|nr:glycosyltransferase family 2 protein [Myxococcales bacterium]MCB9532227.1 glycosyltransferase family 2 protein [Myxococcales bacterium]